MVGLEGLSETVDSLGRHAKYVAPRLFLIKLGVKTFHDYPLYLVPRQNSPAPKTAAICWRVRVDHMCLHLAVRWSGSGPEIGPRLRCETEPQPEDSVRCSFLFRRLDRSADAALPLSTEKSRRPDFSRYGKNELQDQWNVDITLFYNQS